MSGRFFACDGADHRGILVSDDVARYITAGTLGPTVTPKVEVCIIGVFVLTSEQLKREPSVDGPLEVSGGGARRSVV